MTSKNKLPYKNKLALARQRRAIEQKQVAVLLGHKGIDQLSRYERGVKLPSLKAALKLGLIYKIPIRVLLDGYLDACREEIRREEEKLNKPSRENLTDPADEAEFCTIEEKLSSGDVVEIDLAKAYSHAAHLIRRRAEALDHI
ncbi:MAG: helix-turn-helix transcriptional regulator [Pyrinomonadaceae bacterium]